MAEAVILKNKKVVRTSTFDEGSLEFFNSGFLKSFKILEKKYVAVKGKISGEPIGYWDLDLLLRFKAKLISKEEYKIGQFDENDVELAIPQNLEQGIDGDIILYERRRIDVNHQLICFVKFRAPYIINIDEYINNKIALPNSVEELPADCSRIPNQSAGHNFYVDYFGIPEARMPLELRADVPQIINFMVHLLIYGKLLHH